ncbi:MAG: hypothetical protein EBS53_12260 [Bacteroidetes bacterium]|nr:hypothetical protein [Bacteroidota bacterium]
MQKNGFRAKCGGSRRGCCLIVPVAHRNVERYVVLFYQFSPRRPPAWAMVVEKDSTTPDELGETPR